MDYATGKQPMEAPHGFASNRYLNLSADREPFLMRAREMAGLTIPHLFRQKGENGATQAEVPWNSLGAYALSNLASKVVFSIFPPGQSPMKLDMDPKTRQDMLQIEDEQQRADMETLINRALSGVEREFVDAFEEDGDRARIHVGVLKQLCGGTHGYQFKEDGTVRGFPLDRFVCKRDLSGNLIEFVIEDPMSWATIDEATREEIKEEALKPEMDEMTEWVDPRVITVYTHGCLRTMAPYTKPVWEIYQEVWGFEIKGSRYVRYPEVMPYLFAPWILIDGEDYGRSYVEYYEADLQTIEANTQTITQGSAALARMITLVKPGGLTNKKAIAEAENGAVLTGREEDVHTLQGNKGADFQVTMEVTDKAEQRIARAFLLNSSVQRSGERVTAEEIRYVAQELEDAQVGAYSQQVVTLQLPYVKQKLLALQRSKRVTPLPKGTTKVTVVGGLAALGRNAEVANLRDWGSLMAQLLGPNWMSVLGPKAQREIAKRTLTAMKIDQEGLLPSDQEAAQMDQQAQTQQLLMNPAAVEGIKQLGSNLTSTQVAATNAQGRVEAASAKGQAQVESAL